MPPQEWFNILILGDHITWELRHVSDIPAPKNKLYHYAKYLESGRYDYFMHTYSSKNGYCGIWAYDPATRTPEILKVFFHHSTM